MVQLIKRNGLKTIVTKGFRLSVATIGRILPRFSGDLVYSCQYVSCVFSLSRSLKHVGVTRIKKMLISFFFPDTPCLVHIFYLIEHLLFKNNVQSSSS